MKKTTYMMLGAFVAGLIGVVVMTAWFMHDCAVDYEYNNMKYTLGGEPEVMPLGDVTAVKFVDDNNKVKSVRLENYKGITVQESDTACMASILVQADWKPFISCANDSGALSVSIDYQAMRDYYFGNAEKKDKKYRKVVLTPESLSLATVIVPRGALRNVAARRNTIFLDSVNADTLIADVEQRLVLTDSHIKVLESCCKKIDELKLNGNCVIDFANLKTVSRRFKVTCTSEDSKIDKLYIGGVYNNMKSVSLNFSEANIGDFEWNKEDVETEFNINMGKKRSL